MRSRPCPIETITDLDYADDLTLLANTPAQALLYSLEQAARDIVLYVNLDKIEFMYFHQDSAISSSYGNLLRVDQLIYFNSNISSIEIDVNMCIGKR